MQNRFFNPQFSCLLDSSLGGDCEFTLGGLSRILLMNKENVLTANAGTITLTADTAFEMTFVPGSAGFSNEAVFSNGNRYVNQSLTFQVAAKDNTVAEALALGKYLAWVEDRSGDRYLLGRTGYGLSFGNGGVVSMNVGAGEGDFAGLAVTLTNPCTEYAILYTGATPSIG